MKLENHTPVSKSSVSSPQRLKKNRLKNSVMVDTRNSLKSIVPTNKRRVTRESSGETSPIKGLPPISKNETQSISYPTDADPVRKAEKEEIKILNKKISMLEKELSKFKKEPERKESSNNQLNFQKLLTNYVDTPDLSQINVQTPAAPLRLPTYVSTIHSARELEGGLTGEINILKPDEVAHLRPRVRLAVMVYEENLKKLIFASNEISMKGFMNKAEEYFNISQNESLTLARFLFERRNKPKVIFNNSTVRRCNFIIRRLKDFIKKYTKIESDNITDVKKEFDENENTEEKEDFVDQLKSLSRCDFVSPLDIFNLIMTSNLKLDANRIVIYLCRLGNSVSKIPGNVINMMIRKCFEEKPSVRKGSIVRNESLCISKIYSEDNQKQKKDEVVELDKNSKQKIGDKFFQSLADYIKENNTSILDLIQDKVFDKVLNAREYQLIKYKHLYKILTGFGLTITGDTKQGIEYLIPPFLEQTLEIHSLVSTLAKFGCYELFPKSNKHINYRKMEGPTVRILNRIIHQMEKDGQETIEEFFGEGNYTFIEVVSPSKTEQIGVVNHLKLREILREKAIIPYGEDLDEDFQNLLCLSSNRDDLIMLRKMRKIINDTKNVRYFKNFGMYFREESQVDSDYEEQDEKPNMTIDKLINESLIKKNLIENNKSSSDSFDANLLLSMDNNNNPLDTSGKESGQFQSAMLTYADMQRKLNKHKGDQNASHFLNVMSALNHTPTKTSLNKSK